MDPYLRIGLTLGIAAFLKGLCTAWWERFKARKALEPIPLKPHRGVHRPWGIVQQVQHYGGIVGLLYVAQIAILLTLLVYTWIAGPLF